MTAINPRPFVRMNYERNRTPVGRRTATPARHTANYFAFGRDKNQQRGEWIDASGQPQSHADILDWSRAQALKHEYTFQALLSVPHSRLTSADYTHALQQSKQMTDWRLVVHNDTAYSHAHVLFFRDKRLPKEAHRAWHDDLQKQLAQAEAKQLAGLETEQALQQAPRQIDHGLG